MSYSPTPDGTIKLVPRSSPLVIKLSDPQTLKSKSGVATPLAFSLNNFIGPKWSQPRDAWGQWSYIDLGCGETHRPISCTYDGEFICWNGVHGEYVFDISMWKIEEGNHLVLVKGINDKKNNTKNEGDNKGRRFQINDDGTISPKCNSSLCLGASLPVRASFPTCEKGTLRLVQRSSLQAVRLTAPVASSLKSGQTTSLNLMGSGTYVGPKWNQPREAWAQWSYIDLGIGHPNPNEAMQVRYDGDFICWNDVHGEYVFDISMWKIEENNHLVLVKGINAKKNNTKNEGDNKGRKFQINDDGTISPKCNSSLCLGASLPSPSAVEFTMSGWSGYNSRFNGLYKVSDKMNDDFAMYTHMPTEGVGAGADWCRLWYHKGCWRIGHMHWTDHDKERCCAYTASGPVPAHSLRNQVWFDFNGEGSNRDHGIPKNNFVEKPHSRSIVVTPAIVAEISVPATPSAPPLQGNRVEVKACVPCGKQYPLGAKFCANCGKPLTDDFEWVMVDDPDTVKLAVARMI
ncbi:hypothetical protein TrVE_jg14148 [Triparma verrucosa]|uniref:Zinc ribbon domain-containing protein n=1 Tax=Triparma verrucosa TaxID=1606542 RepID=A0A9W7C5L1_9STRA|nr:hypothetical protein TrVE_jg14148 [Triparma verrucosa]